MFIMPARMFGLRQAAVATGTEPTFVAAGTAASGAGSSINIPYYAGLAANDIALVIALQQRGGGASVPDTAISGFTQVTDWIAPDSTFAANVFWKRLSGGESGSVTCNFGASGNVGGVMFGIRGAITTGDPYEGLGTNTGNSGTQTSAALTTIGSNRLGLRMGTDFSGAAASPPSGWSELIDVAASGEIRLDSKSIPAATTTSASAVTIGSSSTWTVHTLAMIPVGG